MKHPRICLHPRQYEHAQEDPNLIGKNPDAILHCQVSIKPIHASRRPRSSRGPPPTRQRVYMCIVKPRSFLPAGKKASEIN
jgi:hypothetical protein